MEKKRFQDIRKVLEEYNYEVQKSIGKGAFGEVVLAKNTKNDTFLAIKILNKVQLKKKPFLKKYIDQQIEIMRKMNHPNIVRYEQQFSTSEFIIIAMEYCEMGNLLTRQAKLPGKIFPIKDSVKIIVQVIKGLKCIHQQDFIHRDIKSENVLLKKGKKENEFEYKIADFGFARSIGGSAAKTFCGTEKYMAPEILSNSYYGISVDIWALGVLFYFMLFAEYPFKSHDMKTEITKRCNPFFSLATTISNKQKLKDMTDDVQDFFKKIFVVDPKKRMNFANILRHPLFLQFSNYCESHNEFYSKIQIKGEFAKDEAFNQEYGLDNQMEPEDQSRAQLLKKKNISNESKYLERELEEIKFQIDRAYYLKECALELFENYTAYLTYPERLATKFTLLKIYLFYAEPLLKDLKNGRIPDSLAQANIESGKWKQCLSTPEFKKYLTKLEEQNMKIHYLYEDTYTQIGGIIQQMPLKNFDKGYKLQITQKTFNELKFAYRSVTSYIFKSIHENKKIDSHLRNKIKMRLFCCHMINRIFHRKEVMDHFPYFLQWMNKSKIEYLHTFDFIYFKKWIYEESQDNIERNIALLHKAFF